MLRPQILIRDRKGQQIKLQGPFIVLQMLIFNPCIMITSCYNLNKCDKFLAFESAVSGRGFDGDDEQRFYDFVSSKDVV